MTPDEWARFWELVAADLKIPGYRVGQAMYNALHMVNPGLAAAIHAGVNDPFYDDTRIAAFLSAVTPWW